MPSRPHLEVSSTCLCVGAESIGLPNVRSVDTVFESYFRLVSRLRAEGREFAPRMDDMVALANATGIDLAAVRHRLQSTAS
ncbi:MAG: hypothetical protein V3V01_06685 [Acidimicrobiales bacterium]